MLLEISFDATYTEQFKALQPLFERMLKRIKVTPVAELDVSQIARGYKSPEVKISQRRDYFLNVSISMILPPGWSAADPLVRHASAAKPRGRMLVEIRRNKDPGGPSFLVVVEGMPPNRPLEPADYLATADRLIDKLMTKHGPGKTVKTNLSPQLFCMGQMKNRIWRGTGRRAHVRSYSGKDDKGRDVRARVYTAGGFSAACNLIFIAQTKDFDKTLLDIEAIIKSIDS